MLFIRPHSLEEITQDALHCYPHECCGFLLGKEENNQRIITHFISCKNIAASKEKSFLISLEDYNNAEKKAEEIGLIVLGIYHSHPDCEAVPSMKDTNNALPYFSYVIISVPQQKQSSARSWRLNDQLLFEEENIIVNHNIDFINQQAYGNHYYSYTFA